MNLSPMPQGIPKELLGAGGGGESTVLRPSLAGVASLTGGNDFLIKWYVAFKCNNSLGEEDSKCEVHKERITLGHQGQITFGNSKSPLSSLYRTV